VIFAGIDPGKRGGIAVIAEDMDVYSLCPIPVITGRKPEYDLPRIVNVLAKQGSDVHVFIERLAPMPPKLGGSAANFQRGYSMGLLQGICTALKFRWTLVSPSVWQKTFWKVRADTKQMSILHAERLFPEVDLLPTERSRKPHDGMADALLIAEHGRRVSTGLLT
jgi:hypothetical protein